MKEKKMRMLRVSMNYPRDINPGGGQHVYYNSLCSDYEERLIISKQFGKLKENRNGVEVIEIDLNPVKLGSYTDSFIKRLTSFFRKIYSQVLFFKTAKGYIDDYKPDVVHLYTPIPILCGLYSKRKYGSKLVVSLHGSDMLRISKVKILGLLFRFVDAIVSVSDNTMELAKNRLINKPIQYIGNGVDLSLFVNRNEERNNKFVHIGSLRWQKGQHFLIKGFGLFLKNNPEYKLEIIGDGPLREELENLCQRLKIVNSVVFKGIQSREQIVKSLNESKAFVLTSVSEGFPKVIIEAMATGTPVLSSDVGNIKSIVKDSGIIFKQQSDVEVCDAMKQITQSDELWEKCHILSEDYAQDYSWERQAEKLNKIYLELLKNKEYGRKYKGSRESQNLSSIVR